ncbi:plasma membrane ferric-chelate reductase [Niveomyces insectorum RCEF 264]|uniref:Plasma membrane ferric-chelate reductase n=1 Tax=Niveomyces insectorum RCEF 264 TaxID=1081102 RepID=A0A167YQB5_9HYPO|nr:plasma membrane ferric-chelate reductase [Niveomyces insectorum RCEF 264]
MRRRFRHFLFMFGAATVHELCHAFVGYLAQGAVSANALTPPNVDHLDYGSSQSQLLDIPRGEAGRWVENILYGGSLEYYFSESDDIGQVGVPYIITSEDIAWQVDPNAISAFVQEPQTPMRKRKSGSLPHVALLLLTSTAWSGTASGADVSAPDGGGGGSMHASKQVVVRDSPDFCFRGCQLALREPQYADIQANASFLTKECSSHLLHTSLFLCLAEYCHGEGPQQLAQLNKTCSDIAHTPLPPYARVLADYPDDVRSGLRRLRRTEAGPKTNVSEVVLPSQQLYEDAYDTLENLNYVRKRHFLYGGLMFLFWFVVVVYGLCSRMVTTASRAFRLRPTKGGIVGGGGGGYQLLSGDEEVAFSNRNSLSPLRRPRVWLRRYVTLPATFGYRCAQAFFGWYTVPPRIQSLTIVAFVALNVATCVVGYKTFPGNMYWPTVSQQLYRYVSDRTGIISYINFPLIWLFGMRNNVLLWLTGWDFGTFNNFHRWVARVATVQAIVHSIGYTILVWTDGGFASFLEWWSMFFWWTGGVATIAMSLLLGLSVFWMRRHMYETFLVVHVVLSVLVLVGMAGHVSIFHGRYDGFFWVCFLVWAADRGVVRGLRILAFNLRFWNTRAHATYDPDANIVRLVIPYGSSSLYRPRPGTYYYLHVLNDRRFWESHPFTVASVGSHPQQDCNEGSMLLAGAHRTHNSTRGSGNGMRPATARAEPPSAMTFLIRPYDGFTARLRDKAQAAAPHPAQLRMLVDGPYGHSQPLDTFDAVLFVAGGSGIVVPLSYLSGFSPSQRVLHRPVRIVWAVREAAFAADVIQRDFRVVFDSASNVTIDVYVTQSPRSAERGDEYDNSRNDGVDDGGAQENAGPTGRRGTPPSWHQVRFLSGRPDVRQKVTSEAQSTTGAGRLAVVACGPALMADDARRAVVNVLGSNGAEDVEYFEESFQW